MPSKQRSTMEDSVVKLYTNQNFANFECFNEFIAHVHSIHVVEINRDVWELSTCNCSDWLKNYKCDHVIAASSRLSK